MKSLSIYLIISLNLNLISFNLKYILQQGKNFTVNVVLFSYNNCCGE